jgi:hypothetical protein
MIARLAPIISTLSGSAGNLTLRKLPRARIPSSIVGPHIRPIQPKNAAQQATYARLAELALAWRALSPEEQSQWNADAAPLALSGHNLFIRSNFQPTTPQLDPPIILDFLPFPFFHLVLVIYTPIDTPAAVLRGLLRAWIPPDPEPSDWPITANWDNTPANIGKRSHPGAIHGTSYRTNIWFEAPGYLPSAHSTSAAFSYP